MACVPDSSSKVDKVLEVHAAYQWVRMGYINTQNLIIDNFHTLSWNEQLDNFVIDGLSHMLMERPTLSSYVSSRRMCHLVVFFLVILKEAFVNFLDYTKS